MTKSKKPPKKPPQRVPADDVHDLPPVNRRIKNRPRPTKRRVVHRADAGQVDSTCDVSDFADVPLYAQLVVGMQNGEDID